MKEAVLFIIATLFLYGCSDTCAGREGCEYERFEESTEVVRVKYVEDDVSEVEFILRDGGYLTLNYWDFEGRVDFDFEINKLADNSNSFLVIGEKIKQGACQPFRVRSVRYE